MQTLNNNLKELGVLESKRGAIRKGLVQELLYAQDTVLCSYFAQREGATNGDKGRRSTAAEVFQGLDRFGSIPKSTNETGCGTGGSHATSTSMSVDAKEGEGGAA